MDKASAHGALKKKDSSTSHGSGSGKPQGGGRRGGKGSDRLKAKEEEYRYLLGAVPRDRGSSPGLGIGAKCSTSCVELWGHRVTSDLAPVIHNGVFMVSCVSLNPQENEC